MECLKMLVILLVITIFTISNVSCETSEQCAKIAQNEFDNALPAPPNFRVPDEFKDIKDLINIIKTIISGLSPTENLNEKLENIEQELYKFPNDLNLLKNGIDILKKIKENAEKLKKQKEFNKKTETTCTTSKDKYNNLLKDLEEIRKLGPKVNETIGKLNIDRINEESLTVKKKLDELQIPINFDEKYLCDKNIFKTFQAIKDTSLNIKKQLEIIRDKIKAELQELTNKLDFSLTNEDIPEMPMTKPQLQNALKFVKQNLKRAEKLRDLLEHKKTMEIDFENLEKTVCNLHKNKVCEIVVPVHVEN